MRKSKVSFLFPLESDNNNAKCSCGMYIFPLAGGGKSAIELFVVPPRCRALRGVGRRTLRGAGGAFGCAEALIVSSVPVPDDEAIILSMARRMASEEAPFSFLVPERGTSFQQSDPALFAPTVIDAEHKKACRMGHFESPPF